MPLELCEDCGWMHWTTDRCKEPKKSSGGSSEVEHRPSKSGVEGSIPSRRSSTSVQDAKLMKDNAGAPADSEAEQGAHISRPSPAIPKPKYIDRHKPGYMSTYMRAYRARKAKLKAEREEK